MLANKSEELLNPPFHHGLTQENRGQGRLGSSFMVRYFRQMGGAKIWLPVLLALTIAETSFAALFRYLLSLWAEVSLDQSVIGLLGITLCVVFGVFVRALSWSSSLVFMSRGARVMHDDAAVTFANAPVTYFDSQPTGRLLARFSDDYERIKREIPNYMLDILSGSIELIWAVVLVIFNAPLLLVVAAPCAWVYKSLQTKFTDASRELQRLTKILESPAWGLFTESVSEQASQSIRVYGRQQDFLRRLESLQSRFGRSLIASSRVTRWLNVRLKLTSEVFALSVALFCIYALEQKMLTVGLAGFLMSLSIGLDGTMQWVTRAVSLMEPALVSVERIATLAKIEPEMGAGLTTTDILETGCSNVRQEPPLLEFRHVSVSYRRGLPTVLHDVSFEAKPGQKIGIIGRTGAGKSTIFQALYRMVNLQSGQILLNGYEGQSSRDLSSLPLEVARGLMTIVPQDPVLFSGTLRYNLDRMGILSDSILWEILAAVGLVDLVSNLPGGLSYVLTEGGTNLSQGERQLLCIARAALHPARHVAHCDAPSDDPSDRAAWGGAPFVLLDEATASVDHHTDMRIGLAMAKAFKSRTMLIIAHRLDTVKNCDCIIALSGGRVVDQGAPEDVLREITRGVRTKDRELSSWLS